MTDVYWTIGLSLQIHQTSLVWPCRQAAEPGAVESERVRLTALGLLGMHSGGVWAQGQRGLGSREGRQLGVYIVHFQGIF